MEKILPIWQEIPETMSEKGSIKALNCRKSKRSWVDLKIPNHKIQKSKGRENHKFCKEIIKMQIKQELSHLE